MKLWKRNAIIVTVMILICGGLYLNWHSSNATKDLTEVVDANKILGEATLVINDSADLSLIEANAYDEENSYFAQMRLSRQTARDQAVNLLQEAMAYAESDTDGQNTAKLEAIVAEALAESQIESMIIAKGYRDCVAYISEEGVSVAVASPEEGLNEMDVSLLADIVMGQTAYSLSDIRIFGVE